MAQSKAFDDLPSSAVSTIQPYELKIPEEEVKRMKDLLKLSRLAGTIYENSLPNGSRTLGLRRDWLLKAKETWEGDFDWEVLADSLVHDCY